MTSQKWTVIMVLFMVSCDMNGPARTHRYRATGSPDGGGLGGRPRAILFVDLVFESGAIAVGRVVRVGPADPAGTPDSVTFEPTRTLRGTLPAQTRVYLSQPTFRPGETCMLFLQQVKAAEATLFGEGDVGKWPRSRPDWVFTAGHVQPLDHVVRIIEALLKVDEMAQYEERAVALSDKLFLGDPLGQIAALQYAASLERWPENTLQGEIDLHTVRCLLVARTLLQTKSLDFAAETALVQLLQDCPPSVALPNWIDRLTHQDVAMRDTAFAALKTEAERWTEDDFGYDARADAAKLAAAKGRWQAWFEQYRPIYLQEDVPKLLEALRAEAVQRREAANLLLRLISGQHVNFVAADTGRNREAAVKRWEQWWEQTKKELESQEPSGPGQP